MTDAALAAVAEHPIDRIAALFRAGGQLAYGESVTQLQHALQTATAAYEDGADPALVTAALLHDVGHLLHPDAGAALHRGVDDRHEAAGAQWLAAWFPAEVTAPIALHVEAKRYLCHVDPSYRAALSLVSVATLRLQGGAMDAASAAAFAGLRHAPAAIRLRRWDEAGKRVGAVTPPLPWFLELAGRCCQR
jgi:phosphonate degradation associated HDIG domain protein